MGIDVDYYVVKVKRDFVGINIVCEIVTKIMRIRRCKEEARGILK